MFRILRIFGRLSIATAVASSAFHFYPIARLGFHYLLSPGDPIVAAEIKLSEFAAPDYEAEINAALDEDDPELARSIASIARERGIHVSVSLDEAIDKADAFSFTRTASEAWSGLVSGNADTPTAFVGALVADLSVAGDVRDLYGEIVKHPDYDELTVALAAAGVIATGSTIVSGLGALPAKAGISLLKSAKKVGKLSRPLQAELKGIATRAIDMDAAKVVMRNAGELDATAALASARRVVRPAAMEKIGEAASSLGSVAGKQGYRGTAQTLHLAESIDDLRHLEKLSDRFGHGYRGVVKLVVKAGGLTIKIGEFFLLMVWKLLGLAVWVIGAIFVAVDMVRATLRAFRRAMPAAA